MLDDAQLLRQYAEENSEAAFTELVRRYLDLVYSAALRQVHGDAHHAQDVAQIVFTTLARKAGSVARHPVLTGWLYTATHLAAAKLRRTTARRSAREQEAYLMNEISGAPDPELDWRQLRPVLDDAMRTLNERDREVVLLRYFARQPFAEIGAVLNVSEDGARMRVERALEKLRTLLARRGVTSTAAALSGVLATQAVSAAPASLAATVAGAALVSAATTAAPLATVLQFMTTSKIVAGVAGVALLAGSLGFATHENRARQTAENSLAAAAGDFARLDGRMRDLQQRTAAAEQGLSELRASLAAAEAQAAKPPPPAATPADPVAAGKEFLAQHPEARELWDQRERANIASKLAPLYRMMNLNPAVQEQLETLILRGTRGTTTFQTLGGPIILQRESALTRAEADAQMQALLGAEGFQRFQELSRVGPTFDLTAKLASALYRVEPLSSQQTDQMMQLFANASPAAKGANPNAAAGPDWNAISAEASNVLSSTQLAALTGLQRNFEYQQAVQKLNRTAIDAARAPKVATPPSP